MVEVSLILGVSLANDQDVVCNLVHVFETSKALPGQVSVENMQVQTEKSFISFKLLVLVSFSKLICIAIVS